MVAILPLSANTKTAYNPLTKPHLCAILTSYYQGKTGWLNEDQSVIMFASASSMNYTVKHKGWRSYRGQCEYFAVYVEALNKVYFIPVDEVGKSQVTLRLTPTKNGQEKHVRWAKDYEL